MRSVKTLLAAMLLLSIPLFLINCQTGIDPYANDTSNWGYVREYSTEHPIPNAKVVVWGNNPVWAVQYTLYTDSNGKFEFPLSNYLPEVQASAFGYYTSERTIFKPRQTGRVINLYQPAQVNLHIKNVNQVDNSDCISLNLKPFLLPDLILQGKNIDTVYSYLASLRHLTVDIKAVIIKNGIESNMYYRSSPTKSHGNIVDVFY